MLELSPGMVTLSPDDTVAAGGVRASRTSEPEPTSEPHHHELSRVLIVCIEGGIGAGKSTALACVRRNFGASRGVVILDEPVEAWDAAGLLRAMYDGTLNRGSFQHMALMSRAGPLLKAINNPATNVIITERSPWSDCFVFGQSNLTGIELTNYMFTFEQLMSAFPKTVVPAFVLVDLPIDVAQKRIRQRNRGAESTDDDSEGIPEDYLKTLQAKHETFLTAMEAKDYVVHRVDAQEEPEIVGEKLVASVKELVRSMTDTPKSPTSVLGTTEELPKKNTA